MSTPHKPRADQAPVSVDPTNGRRSPALLPAPNRNIDWHRTAIISGTHAAEYSLEEAWALARDKPQGTTKFLNKYTAFTLLVIDEWLLDHPDESMRSMLLELLERRYDTASTVFCTQYAKKDWHQRLGSGVHADAIMDRIVHNTIWVDTGTRNMREHTSMQR